MGKEVSKRQKRQKEFWKRLEVVDLKMFSGLTAQHALRCRSVRREELPWLPKWMFTKLSRKIKQAERKQMFARMKEFMR